MSSLCTDWAKEAAQQEKLLQRVEKINISPGEQNSQPKQPSQQKMPAEGSSKPGSVSSSEDDSVELSKAEASLLQKVVRKGLIVSKHDIEVQRKDPTSPLYSVKTFEALHLKPQLLKGVYEMGFNAPSKIQETALPTLLADPPQNMIAQSQSGTGKTAAFVLAMLSRVDAKKSYPQVLCLSPTYELAIQIGDVAIKMGQFCPEIKIRFAIRGEEVPKGTILTEHIIIGTPGKVVDWALKFRFFDLSKIRVFVLDEADVMIATQGHQDQSFRIRKALTEQCQMMFFSATYDEHVMEFAEAIVTNPVTIRLKREEESLDNIKQYYVECKNQDAKYAAIANIYGVATIGQAMIFCHTRKTASWLSEKMSKDGHAVALLSGELTVEQRIAILDRFREGKEKVLITTNVLARGIDIEQVTIVVNFDLPIDQAGNADCETYLHRIGRTGRFGKAGLAINLVDGPQSRRVLIQIEEHFGKKIVRLNTDDVDEIEKLGNE
ncbi:DEAD-box helicase Dbp80-like isoform X1 [Homalodisca vitripennis]|uniref:DEAD-box helicase Dbp80-like isoform X1 n=2 Tax=Homalodisca vitripennis TaxID=197043 RepID=UPI001EEB2C90|nr:DEAD-box helicase Dbp80-like isoform X1 [Homalodisca vitripennis]KAG8269066.1 ATP-dependent RNA helicase ddx25 [Homalodisca vitripennis]